MTERARSLVLLVLMFAAAVGAVVLKPTARLADRGPKIDLQRMIPAQFGEWREDTIQQVAHVVNPEQQELLDKLYSQTLSRTYVNTAGRRIMLSIAYGDDQTGRLRVHRPDVCYAAQGFLVTRVVRDQILINSRQLTVVRANAAQAGRNEPITYWMTVGNSVASSGFEQRIQQLRYGLAGEIPDGIIFRVSSIGSDDAKEHALQDSFVRDLLASVPAETKRWLMGSA